MLFRPMQILLSSVHVKCQGFIRRRTLFCAWGKIAPILSLHGPRTIIQYMGTTCESRFQDNDSLSMRQMGQLLLQRERGTKLCAPLRLPPIMTTTTLIYKHNDPWFITTALCVCIDNSARSRGRQLRQSSKAFPKKLTTLAFNLRMTLLHSLERPFRRLSCSLDRSVWEFKTYINFSKAAQVVIQ